MVFGKQFRPATQSDSSGSGPRSAITRDRLAALLVSVFAGLMLLLALGGCGSGNGGNNNNGNNGNDGGNTTTTVTRLTGKVIDRNNNDNPVVGAVVSYAGVTVTTDNSGIFIMTVPANQPQTSLTVVGPANSDGTPGYYNTGVVGSMQYVLTSNGSNGFFVAPIPSGQTRDLGTIIIFSQSGTGPPPPPIFPQ